MSKTSLLELLCDVDDFWKELYPIWIEQLIITGDVKRIRESQLSMSGIMTIIIHFHQLQYRKFKANYREHVQVHWYDFVDDLAFSIGKSSSNL